MKGKLIKVDNEYKLFQISEPDGTLISVSGELSIKNCNAIANGYDLEELACDKIGIDISVVKHIDNKLESHSSPCIPLNEGGCVGAGLYHMVKGFEIGFQKALEILGDKKFSEEDMREAISQTRKGMLYNKQYEDEHIQSLQQTEWDVEIETEEVIIGQCNCECHSNTRILHFMPCCNPKIVTNPKLDTNGCLILKKI
jgi:hypothetical protein